MISIRKYLDRIEPVAAAEDTRPQPGPGPGDLCAVCLDACRSTLRAMGHAGAEACPALGTELESSLASIAESIAASPSPETVLSAGASLRTHLEDWGRSAARHYQHKASEVKEILLVMAQTAESVGDRDQRCSQQFCEVTANLNSIASLDDISQIRISITKSASDLKGSIERMTAEGREVLGRLRAQVATFETRLADAELIASCDTLTRLRSRLWMETHIELRVAAAKPFCLALLDLDGFKSVNDKYGHLAGDDVLRQFAAELKSACRSTDMVGRWGGDEFLVLLDGGSDKAQAQIDRVRKWVCGSYAISKNGYPLKLPVRASIGLAEFTPGDDLKRLLGRADAAMYRDKIPCCQPAPLRR